MANYAKKAREQVQDLIGAAKKVCAKCEKRVLAGDWKGLNSPFSATFFALEIRSRSRSST